MLMGWTTSVHATQQSHYVPLTPKHLYSMNYRAGWRLRRAGRTRPPPLVTSQNRVPSTREQMASVFETEDLVPSAILWAAMKVGDPGFKEGNSALRTWAVE